VERGVATEELPVWRNSAAPEMAARTTAAPPTASSPTSRMCTATFIRSVPYPICTCHTAQRGEEGGKARRGRVRRGRVSSEGVACLQKISNTADNRFGGG
jgi:hypothetical protein